MFAAHGLRSQTDDRVWFSHETPPPFHPNLVVLTPTTTREDIEAYAVALGNHQRHSAWSLKDSYAKLDLGPRGFSLLFQADWIWRDPDAAGGARFKSRLKWTRVATPAGLSDWERAWSGDTRNESALLRTRQFPTALLESPDHVFFAGLLEGKVLAGGVANRSPGAVGLSNIFSPPEFLEDAWNALMESVTAAFPGAAIVGYERGHDFDLAQRVGFRPIGKLRVWCWPASTGP